MKSLRLKNNEQQYQTALEGLREYNVLLQTVDSAHSETLDEKMADCVEKIKQYKASIKGLKGSSRHKKQLKEFKQSKSQHEELLKKYKAERTNQMQERKNIPTDAGIEYIVNVPNGHMEIILPIKKENLTKKGNTLADKLYSAVEKTCMEYTSDDILFDEYMGFSLEGLVDKREIARNILANVPEEFGSSDENIRILYLRTADNFSFVSQPSHASKTSRPRTSAKKSPKKSAPKPTEKPIYAELPLITSKVDLYAGLDTLRAQNNGKLKLTYDTIVDNFRVQWEDKDGNMFDYTDGSKTAKQKMAGFLATTSRRWNKAK
tara:strand:+ start:66365 stop:67321 length:957 start_codon:yes stop_codon:yes gene_type:complete